MMLCIFVDEWDSKRSELPFNYGWTGDKVNDRAQFDKLGTVGKTPRVPLRTNTLPKKPQLCVKDIVI